MWSGKGLNHEGQTFNAVLVGRPLYGGAMAVWFSARGLAGELYHEELGVLGADAEGRPLFTSSSTSVPFMQVYSSPVAITEKVELHFGDHADLQSFRETLLLELMQPGRLRVSFSWGMPGDAVAEKSSVTVERTEASPPENCPLK
jgi:hypothetical protein